MIREAVKHLYSRLAKLEYPLSLRLKRMEHTQNTLCTGRLLHQLTIPVNLKTIKLSFARLLTDCIISAIISTISKANSNPLPIESSDKELRLIGNNHTVASEDHLAGYRIPNKLYKVIDPTKDLHRKLSKNKHRFLCATRTRVLTV